MQQPKRCCLIMRKGLSVSDTGTGLKDHLPHHVKRSSGIIDNMCMVSPWMPWTP
jgi:hypothetical protein